jgi:alpha-beta hydrolase superfamily lysophospholipase
MSDREDFNLLVQNMGRLAAMAKEEYPETPFMPLGHSMGSFAAQQFVLDHSNSIDGWALSGSGPLDRLVPSRNLINAPRRNA